MESNFSFIFLKNWTLLCGYPWFEAAFLSSLPVLSGFQVLSSADRSRSQKHMHQAEKNAFCSASGAKGEPLLRNHLKPQLLEGQWHSLCVYHTNTATLLNLYLLQRSAEYLDTEAVLWCSPRQCVHLSTRITVLNNHLSPQGCSIQQACRIMLRNWEHKL